MLFHYPATILDTIQAVTQWRQACIFGLSTPRAMRTLNKNVLYHVIGGVCNHVSGLVLRSSKLTYGHSERSCRRTHQLRYRQDRRVHTSSSTPQHAYRLLQGNRRQDRGIVSRWNMNRCTGHLAKRRGQTLAGQEHTPLTHPILRTDLSPKRVVSSVHLLNPSG